MHLVLKPRPAYFGQIQFTGKARVVKLYSLLAGAVEEKIRSETHHTVYLRKMREVRPLQLPWPPNDSDEALAVCDTEKIRMARRRALALAPIFHKKSGQKALDTENLARRSRNRGRDRRAENKREWKAADAVIEARVMKPKTIPPHGRGVGDFLTQHAEEVTGVVSGFDRLRLQGTLRALYEPELFQNYLWRVGVRYKDFKPHLKMVTGRICAAADEIARCAGTAVRHVRSAATRKEDLVAESLRAHPRDEGLVAVLSALEPCRTWKIRSNRATKRLEPRLEFSKCLHLYFYFIHEQFGLRHLRLQTWFPFFGPCLP